MQNTQQPNFVGLLRSAVEEPGSVSTAYRQFHAYSLGNQLLAMFQCHARGLQPCPMATYPRWKELGRHVRKGEKALMLCMPITVKRRNDATDSDSADGSDPWLGKTFLNWFEEVDIKEFSAREVFNFYAQDRRGFQFFQSRTVSQTDEHGNFRAGASISKALPGAVVENVFDDGYQFVLSLPLRDSGIQFSVLSASYLVFFFLSELVRYYPNRIDHIAEHTDAWPIESTVKSTPEFLLRHLVGRILKKTLVLTPAGS